jgi:hypothetical protein
MPHSIWATLTSIGASPRCALPHITDSLTHLDEALSEIGRDVRKPSPTKGDALVEKRGAVVA